ncbi:MAG TPA: hypothetical protein DGO89_14535 [Microcoleaceae bacterium UBA9251]|nr:hypothetical protein [Microcoleaceae cyanobacterium UBA9251]
MGRSLSQAGRTNDDFTNGFWAARRLVIGHWSLVIGHWSLVIGHWSLVIGHWAEEYGNYELRITN